MPVVKSMVLFASAAGLTALVVAVPARSLASGAWEMAGREAASYGPAAFELRPTDSTVPRGATCSADCNSKASDCIDLCEEKFKDDDKARVTCKFECTQKRQQCEKSCE
jgi:hypothetical protein